MRLYFKKKIIKHHQILLSVIILTIGFFTILFLYNNFYKIQLDIANIYTLKGELNTVTIDTKNFDYAYEVVEQKINKQKTSIINIKSPF